jgi:hypothetical protein
MTARGDRAMPKSTLPLHLCQVLEEELAALDPSGRNEPRSWQFQDDDFVDATRFVNRLRGAPEADRLGRELASKLGDPPRLAEVLNVVLEDRHFYTRERFASVRIDWDVVPLLSLTLDSADDVAHLNRRLLENAYPEEIRPIYEARLAGLYAALHARAGARPRAALCLSGGGIRSATFGLGVVQGLARLRVLHEFDYLSTVSGGGYLGGWLSAWAHRDPKRDDAQPGGARPGGAKPANVTRSDREPSEAKPDGSKRDHPEAAAAKRDDSGRDGAKGFGRLASALAPVTPRSPLEPELGPIRHLRRYTNYLTPTLGLLSADTWTLVATYVRNLLLNWLVLVPLLLAAVMVPRIVTAFLNWDHPPDGVRLGFLLLGLGCLSQSTAYLGFYRPSRIDLRRRRGHREPSQRDFLLWCLLPLAAGGLFLLAYWLWPDSGTLAFRVWVTGRLVAASISRPSDRLWFVTLGVAFHVAAWLVYSARLGRFDPRELLVVVCTGGIGGWLVWLAASSIPLLPGPDRDPTLFLYYVCFGVPVFLVVFLLTTTAFIGLLSLRTDDEDREWWARLGAWVLIVTVGWALFSALVLLAPLWLRCLAPSVKTVVASVGGTSGLAAALIGRSAATSAKGGPPARGLRAFLATKGLMLAAIVGIASLMVALSLLTNIVLVEIKEWLGSWAPPSLRELPSDFSEHVAILTTTPQPLALVVLACLGVAAGLLGIFINVNKFSLHAMYRARLTRAYLGASREHRHPNPFTGFDPDDNIQMHELRPEAFDEQSFRNLPALVRRLRARDGTASQALMALFDDERRKAIDGDPKEPPSSACRNALCDGLNALLEDRRLVASRELGGDAENRRLPFVARVRRARKILETAFPDEIAGARPPGPLHVVNMALNLVAGHNLAWQERKAESFTVTPWHAGSYHVGYRRSREYGGQRPGRQGISLATAIAISGAAASPNMGYHSSPLLAFLMTLFNVRLGWWLGNPGPSGESSYRRACPMPSTRPLVEEALGLTDDTNAWVYLSDGGHFDNLGLLEMVLRRCHIIVLSDAGSDPACSFQDLGSAIRNIRADLGIPVSIEHALHISSRDKADASAHGGYAAIATIDYTAVDGPQAVKGKLLYVKPCVYWRTEPIDVQNYARANVTFPHESTADQFFSESQFESYRALGLHEIQQVWSMTWPGSWPDDAVSLADFAHRFEEYVTGLASAGAAGA